MAVSNVSDRKGSPGPDEIQETVILVEGTLDERLRRTARRPGLMILETTNVADALRATLRLRPTLIIVQVQGIAKAGLEFIRMVSAATRGIPLIAVGASDESQLEQAVWEAGANWYVPNAATTVLDSVLNGIVGRVDGGREG